MKLNNPKIILGFFSVLVGIVISTQFKMKLETSYSPITVKSLEETRAAIVAVNNEISQLNKIIQSKEEELSILENIVNGGNDIIEILNDDIKYNKMHSGRTALRGPGIKITMYDNPEERAAGFDLNNDIIHDADILNIINDLRIAGAEAISINGERVVSTSEIKCGGPIIRINGRSSVTPFVISVIGDPKLLYASVIAPGTYGDILKSVYQIGFEVSVEDSLVVPAYRGQFSYNYAKPVGEEE